MTDDEFIEAFENASLDGASFHHADHVRMAYLHLCRYPVLDALQRFSASLMRLAASLGKPGLYHETITWAFLLLIHERMARGQGARSWAEFAAANQDLMTWENNVLKKYYRDETLSSALAKRTFMFPDKISL